MKNWKIMDLRQPHPRESEWLILNTLKLQSKFQPLTRLLVLVLMTLHSQFQPLFKLLSSRKVSYQIHNLKMWLHPIYKIPSAPAPIWVKHTLWIHHVTVCLIWIHPAFHLNYKTTQVLLVFKLIFFLNQKNNWIIPTFHQQMFSLSTLTINCSYYKRSLMYQMTLSTTMTLITVKIKSTSSSMPPTLATPLHYPNSWHNTTLKTRSPLMIKVQY